jgi:methionyl aminopeptidase
MTQTTSITVHANGKIHTELFVEVEKYLRPGLSTMDVENKIKSLAKSKKVTLVFIGFDGYKYGSCVSVNHELIHGVPSKEKIIKNGDLVKVDVAIKKDGLITDAAICKLVEESQFPENTLGSVIRKYQYHGLNFASR